MICRINTDRYTKPSPIDQELSVLLFGERRMSFKPSTNEDDAWMVVDWLMHHCGQVQLTSFIPRCICEHALAHARNNIKVCA